ncbi:helix-turn-helix transcriptional regulator [Staphylococcus ursi]|uniref:helix-turn-helix domain-containing protein n=1 Tax=Staphylococcus sp. MI 10-1553 TaxID=1912064 RepID=UPI0013993C13|nr:helix-turn-helix transcriptional regulator [Staphylococcus sp. MI 10-1553]QHW38091.1 helix-turn-helix transcriptional regulator [Staphylococcus sp. MI 10-1553]
MTSFSSNLEQLMKSRDMNDSDLADLVDVNRTTITRWKKGIRSPKLEKLPEIAEVFGVHPIDLIREKSDESIVDKIQYTSAQLSIPRQKRVLDYAKAQLDEQNK